MRCAPRLVEDKDSLEVMDNELVIGKDENWTAPLPFQTHVPLPNNKAVEERRSFLVDKSLHKNPTKRKHFVDFMTKGLELVAEVVPDQN